MASRLTDRRGFGEDKRLIYKPYREVFERITNLDRGVHRYDFAYHEHDSFNQHREYHAILDRVGGGTTDILKTDKAKETASKATKNLIKKVGEPKSSKDIHRIMEASIINLESIPGVYQVHQQCNASGGNNELRLPKVGQEFQLFLECFDYEVKEKYASFKGQRKTHFYHWTGAFSPTSIKVARKIDDTFNATAYFQNMPSARSITDPPIVTNFENISERQEKPTPPSLKTAWFTMTIKNIKPYNLILNTEYSQRVKDSKVVRPDPTPVDLWCYILMEGRDQFSKHFCFNENFDFVYLDKVESDNGVISELDFQIEDQVITPFEKIKHSILLKESEEEQ